MKHRGSWQGMWTIVRFNWPFYLVAGVILGACVCGTIFWWGGLVACLLGIMAVGLLYFIVGSLGVSHLIYDRSDLYRFGWLGRALSGKSPEHVVFSHSGFDEASDLMQERFGGEWMVLDHFDEVLMKEPSIRRARRAFPSCGDTVQARFDDWPVDAGWADVVFGILALHELREEPNRVAWFREAGRCLNADGRIVVVEHLRDFANLLAFGPGFMHFHSRNSWGRCWKEVGLSLADEFRITPWVRCFVLKKDE